MKADVSKVPQAKDKPLLPSAKWLGKAGQHLRHWLLPMLLLF
jgi:hypothetical protein